MTVGSVVISAFTATCSRHTIGSTMSPEVDPEAAEKAKLARQKHTVAVTRLRQQWQREGYDPRRHLDLAMAQGDGNVLAFMLHRERDGRDTTRNFAVWLAVHDIYEAFRIPRIDWEAMTREAAMSHFPAPNEGEKMNTAAADEEEGDVRATTPEGAAMLEAGRAAFDAMAAEMGEKIDTHAGAN